MSALIEFEQVCKYYQMGDTLVKAADHITMKIEKGEFVAIVGQSGSGKSTLMNVLGCLDIPTYGEYFLNGTDVTALSDKELAHIRNREIGFIFQFLLKTPAELPMLPGKRHFHRDFIGNRMAAVHFQTGFCIAARGCGLARRLRAAEQDKPVLVIPAQQPVQNSIGQSKSGKVRYRERQAAQKVCLPEIDILIARHTVIPPVMAEAEHLSSGTVILAPQGGADGIHFRFIFMSHGNEFPATAGNPFQDGLKLSRKQDQIAEFLFVERHGYLAVYMRTFPFPDSQYPPATPTPSSMLTSLPLTDTASHASR